MSAKTPNTESWLCYLATALICIGCSEEPSRAAAEAVAAGSKAVQSAATQSAANNAKGTGHGTFTLPGERFEFAVTDCSTSAYQLGGAKYHLSFTGHGTSSNGRSFNIMGHHATGADGKGPLDRQTILLAEKLEATDGNTAAGTFPAAPRVLERTNYFRDGEGWMRAGRRPSADEGPLLHSKLNRITGTADFSGAPNNDPTGRSVALGTGNLQLVCQPID